MFLCALKICNVNTILHNGTHLCQGRESLLIVSWSLCLLFKTVCVLSANTMDGIQKNTMIDLKTNSKAKVRGGHCGAAH